MSDTNRGGDTRLQIQRVALELFTEQGFEKTSLREIADRLGVTKAALYYHYPSKSELIRSIVQPVLDPIDVIIERAEAMPAIDVREFLGETFDLFSQHEDVFTALIRDASAFAHIDLEGRAQRWAIEIPDVLAGKDATPPERVYAWVAFSGLLRAAVMNSHSDIPLEVVRTASIDAAYAALYPHQPTGGARSK